MAVQGGLAHEENGAGEGQVVRATKKGRFMVRPGIGELVRGLVSPRPQRPHASAKNGY